MNFSAARKTRFKPSLDATPLIDVVFLLLIFLLLTTTFAEPREDRPEEAIIDVQLAPSASAKDEAPPESIDVYLDELGRVYLDSSVPLEQEEWVRILDEKSRQTQLQINLKADKRVSHGLVIETLDAIKAIGIDAVNLVLEKKEP